MPSRPFACASIAVAVLLLSPVGWALANRSGPPSSVTGAPAVGGVAAERTCNQSGCHSGNPVNDGQGSIRLVDAPVQYTPGQEYTLSLEFSSSSTSGAGGRRWGYQITAVNLADGRGDNAGTWTQGVGQVQRTNFSNGRRYISHSANGVQQGAQSPVTIQVVWTAPATDQGPIGFYFAGNAANGDGNNQGDFIYTGADTVQGQETAVDPTSWGGLKSADWNPGHP